MRKSIKTVWDESIDLLRDELDPQIFSAWIRPLKISSASSVSNPISKIEIITPSTFSREQVKSRYSSAIKKAVIRSAGSKEVFLSFLVDQENIPEAAQTQTPVHNVEKSCQVKGKTPRELINKSNNASETGLNPKLNFSNFVVGSCNQFAHAIAMQIAQNLGNTYNPLFIYGGVGLGKTHLANAIGNYCRRHRKKCLLVSSEVFVNELIAAIRTNNMHSFKGKFRSVELLVIDDIQFLIGKERTQEEFFHTFNELHHRRKQIVVTSDKLPQDLVGLEERLRTRFASGLSVDLQVPDYETRVAIISQKSESVGMKFPKEATILLAEMIDSNIRELEGAMNRICALAKMKKEPISLDLAKNALKELTKKNGKPSICPDSIRERVAMKFKVSCSDLTSKRRTSNIALARQVAMFLCRKHLSCSYPEIGSLFGGRDHSTVIYACRCIEEKLEKDKSLSSVLVSLEEELL